MKLTLEKPVVVFVGGMDGSGKSRLSLGVSDNLLRPDGVAGYTFHDYLHSTGDMSRAVDRRWSDRVFETKCHVVLNDAAWIIGENVRRDVEYVRRVHPDYRVFIVLFANDPDACRANVVARDRSVKHGFDRIAVRTAAYDVKPEDVAADCDAPCMIVPVHREGHSDAYSRRVLRRLHEAFGGVLTE